MPALGPGNHPSMSTVDNTRSEKEQALLRIQQELHTISQNHGAFINHVNSLLKQQKQLLELRISTQMSQQCPSSSQQQNQVSICPIVPISATQTSTQPSYSQPRQHVSNNQTATIHHNLHQPKPLRPLSNDNIFSFMSNNCTSMHERVKRVSTVHPITLDMMPLLPTAFLQNCQQQQPSLVSQPTRSATHPTGSPTLLQNSHQQELYLPSQPTRSATQPTGSPTLIQNSQPQEPSLPSQPTRDFKATLKEIEAIMSNIVGLEGIKSQIRKWSFGLLQDEKRRALGLDVGPRKTLHMAFLGNPGTGKTMIALTLGKVLHLVGLISKDKVTEVQRTDLVDEYIGKTGLKTRKKIKQARGGILFVDEAYRLMPQDCRRDFGIEALGEIMVAMNRRYIVIIFAGYNVEMNCVISANPGLFRRVSNKFYFDDYTLIDMARILHLKMDTKERDSFTYGYRLDSNCSVEAISELIEERTTEEQRKKLNGGIVDPLVVSALEHLDLRLDVDCTDATSLLTITMEDLEAGP